MQIEVKIDPDCKESKVMIISSSMTEEITQLLSLLQQVPIHVVTGFRKDTAIVLEPMQIYRFYAANQKVYAVTAEGEYTIRKRLYELETQLDSKLFVRISNSDIVNLRLIEQFDLSFAGTICVRMRNKECVYVSRRYVARMKQLLGL